MQTHYRLPRTDRSTPLAPPTSGRAKPDVHLGLSLSCNSEGEFHPCTDTEDI